MCVGFFTSERAFEGVGIGKSNEALGEGGLTSDDMWTPLGPPPTTTILYGQERGGGEGKIRIRL